MRLIIILFVLFITGCATLSSEECLNADWYIIGLEDGGHGYAVTRISNHRKACAKHNITPNLERYKAGLKEGYLTYCTAVNGYRIGAAGSGNNAVCTGAAGRKFTQSYNLGYERYQVTSAISQLDAQIQAAHDAIAELLEDSEYHEDQLIHHARNATEKREHLDAIKSNSADISRNENFIFDASQEHENLIHNLYSVEKKHRELGY